VEPAGKIKRIVTAVLLDDLREVSEENGQKVEKRRKRTAQEMAQVQELAKGAVGFDDKRGDQLTVEDISFEVFPPEPVPPPSNVQRVQLLYEQWKGLARYPGMIALFALVYLLVLRPIKKQVLVVLARGATPLAPAREAAQITGAAEAPAMTQPHRTEGVASALPKESAVENPVASEAVKLKRVLADRVKKDPEGASRLIQSWIRKDEEQG